MKLNKILLSVAIAVSLASCARESASSTDGTTASTHDESAIETIVEQTTAKPDSSHIDLAHDILSQESAPLTDRERFEQRLELAQTLIPMKVRDDVWVTKAALDGDYLCVQITLTEPRIDPAAVTTAILTQKVEPLRQGNSILSETLELMRSAGIGVKLDIYSRIRGTSSTLIIPASEL